MSYSGDFRKKVLAKLDEGYSIRAVASQFEIDKNTILSWKKYIETKRRRPRKPSKIDNQVLKDEVESIPLRNSITHTKMSVLSIFLVLNLL